MTEEYVTFQSFNDGLVAEEVASKLKEQGIPFRFLDTSSPIDPLIVGSPLAADLRLTIRQQDFERANRVLEAYYSTQLEQVEKDYHLFTFTDQELMEIVRKPDEWGHFDYQLALKILAERGQPVSKDKQEIIRQERVKEVARPERVGTTWILLGYFLAIFFGPIGILFSSTVLSLKRTLPDGHKAYVYTHSDRKHAQVMLMISLALTAVWIQVRFLRPS